MGVSGMPNHLYALAYTSIGPLAGGGGSSNQPTNDNSKYTNGMDETTEVKPVSSMFENAANSNNTSTSDIGPIGEYNSSDFKLLSKIDNALFMREFIKEGAKSKVVQTGLKTLTQSQKNAVGPILNKLSSKSSGLITKAGIPIVGSALSVYLTEQEYENGNMTNGIRWSHHVANGAGLVVGLAVSGGAGLVVFVTIEGTIIIAEVSREIYDDLKMRFNEYMMRNPNVFNYLDDPRNWSGQW